ncbi:unnamed protein product [Sphagnum balticum]
MLPQVLQSRVLPFSDFSPNSQLCSKLLLQGGIDTLGIHVYGLLHLEKDSEKRRNRHGDEAKVGDNSVRRKGATAASCIEGRRGVSLRPTNQPIGASPPLPSPFSSPTILEILEASILPVPSQKLITLPVQQSPVTKAVISSSFGV